MGVKFIFNRFVDETQEVVAYELKPERISAEFKKKSIGQKIAIFNNLAAKKTFDQLKKFFEPIKQKTAPQGLGYEITAELIGDPLMSIPVEILFVGNWPGPLTQGRSPLGGKIKFFNQKVTHKFTKAGGYTTSLHIADAFAITGSAIVSSEI